MEQLNEAKKDYPIASHTAEHILNQTMVRMFGCDRSRNAHIERKKSKCDYLLTQSPSEEEVRAIERQVNNIINQHLPVTIEIVSKTEAEKEVDLTHLPTEAQDLSIVRLVRIGDYDVCPCIGAHVNNTSEIGVFTITTHSFENGVWRVRWKVG